MKARAIFFDRDGTINIEKDFIADPDELDLVPGAVDALKRASSLGFSLFVISNQSGVARGIMTEGDVEKVNQRLEQMLKHAGVELDGIYYCPHYPSITGACECRKPNRGMIDQALTVHDIDLAKSFVVGDRKLDIELAFNVGARSIMVLTGYGEFERTQLDGKRSPDYIASDILDAVRWIEHNG